MTIRPAEMEPKIFYERLRANPRGWLSGFVNYVDRSRLLGMIEPILAEGASAPAKEGT